jgi:hypothetical protein
MSKLHFRPEGGVTNPIAQTLVRVLVHLIFSTQDRANVIRPNVESEVIQFVRKHGVEYDDSYIWR